MPIEFNPWVDENFSDGPPRRRGVWIICAETNDDGYEVVKERTDGGVGETLLAHFETFDAARAAYPAATVSIWAEQRASGFYARQAPCVVCSKSFWFYGVEEQVCSGDCERALRDADYEGHCDGAAAWRGEGGE